MTTARPRAITSEGVLFLGTVLLALAVRLGGLVGPLSPIESERALAAWQLQRGLPPEWWQAPTFTLTQAAAFTLFGDSDAAARLIPLLAGTALTAALWLFRPWFGALPTLLGATFVAVSPAAAQTAGFAHEQSLAALVTLLIGWALLRFWDEDQARFTPLLGLGAAALLNLGFAGVSGALALSIFAVGHATVRSLNNLPSAPLWAAEWHRMGAAFLGGCFILSGGLALHLSGVGLPSLIAWTQAFDPTWQPAPWFQAWLLLAAAAPPALVGVPAALLALAQWLRAPQDNGVAAAAFLAIWGLLGLASLLLGNDFSPVALATPAVPLTILAGRSLGIALIGVGRDFFRATWPNFVAAAVLIVFAGLTLAGNAAFPERGPLLTTAIAFLALATVFLLLSPMATTYSRPLALPALAGVAVLLAVSVHTSSLPWPDTPRVTSTAAAYVTQVTALSPYTVEGRRQQMEITEALMPALKWQLRNVPGVSYVGQPSPEHTPVVVTEAAFTGTPEGYQARPMSLIEERAFQDWSLHEISRWLLYGELPLVQDGNNRVLVLTR